MKIAFIGQKGIPALCGGVERHVEDLAMHLVRRGAQVTVYSRRWYTQSEMTQYKGIDIVYTPSIRTKHLDAITHSLISTIHALFQDFDVIHYHGDGPALVSWLPRLFKPRVRVVTTFHCINRRHEKWNWLARLALRIGEWAACHIAHRTITVSQSLQKYARDVYDSTPEYLPNGVPTPLKVGSGLIEQRFGLAPRSYFLAASRLVRHKNIHQLMEAFRVLRAVNQLGLIQKLVIAGEGSFTSDYVRELKADVNGDPDIMLVGLQTGETLAELFANAYAFVHPSKTEGLALAILEAASYGTAVIASDIEENKEAAGPAGLYFAVNAVPEMVRQMKYAIDHPTQMRVLGQKSRAYVLANYDWERIARQTLELYKDAMSEVDTTRELAPRQA